MKLSCNLKRYIFKVRYASYAETLGHIMKTDTMNVDAIKKVLQELREIDTTNDYAYEEVIWKYLTCVRLPIFVYTLPKNSMIFRARTHEKDDYFFNISDIGLTPKKFVTDFGRCNRPNQSVFYASENRPTSYAELVKSWSKKGHKIGTSIFVTIGAWKLKKNLDLILVSTPKQEDRISDFDKENGVYLDKYISEYGAEEQKVLKEIYHFLFEFYRKPSNDYNQLLYYLTTGYANLALAHNDSKAYGVYYPSVPYLHQGVNFAINGSFAKENLELTSALRNKFTIILNDDGKPVFRETDKTEAIKIDTLENTIEWNK